ncbi:MAG: electron transfer flavoprotein subunit beta/FixA family protein [Bdellovibrionales bacterium]
MKIFVCVKQVPDTETKLRIRADGSGIEPAGIKWVMNPYDEFAVEEAIKLRDANPGSQIFVATAGPKERAADVLRTALAMGADEGVVIYGPENLDAYSTAKALAEAIKKEGGADVIFTGKLAIDQNQASVSQMLAEFLGIPHTSVVSKFQFADKSAKVERDVEGGAKEKIQMPAPCLVAANKGLNMPRYASLPGIMKAKKKVLKEYELSALGVSDTDRKVVYSQYSLPPEKPAAKLLQGDATAQVTELVRLLRDEAKAL